jgi:alpha,alpha-trehalase
MKLLGRDGDAGEWLGRAEKRRRLINDLLWDERDGLYYDYNYVDKKVRHYPYVTTFWPLWAGIADSKQAARVAANLHLFERPGGLQTSTNVSGNQWDAPFGWANLQMMAVKGLRRYGYREEADRISVRFLSMVLKEFIDHNTVVEKYDVVRRQSQLGAGIKFGYSSNEIGFGWSNAAFVEMYAELPDEKKPGVLDLN